MSSIVCSMAFSFTDKYAAYGNVPKLNDGTEAEYVNFPSYQNTKLHVSRWIFSDDYERNS